jgi:LacI family transcriptional regulator
MIAQGVALPRAIICANDQTAIGVMAALAQHDIAVPGQVAVTGFDDIPVARHLSPQLTTVKQSIQDLGSTAFEAVYSMINATATTAATATAGDEPRGRDIVLPTRLIRRESCGCGPEPVTSGWRVA